jgi:hypothetical protein
MLNGYAENRELSRVDMRLIYGLGSKTPTNTF